MTLQGCAELVHRGDPDRFRAAMAAPPEARTVLFPLYAFNLEVSRAPWLTEEPMIAEMRLQWWRDTLEEIGQGAPARAHEVVVPLAAIPGLETATLDRLVEARRWDIYREPFADRGEFDAYLEHTAAGLMWAAARALGAPDDAAPAVRAYGWAAGLAALLRAVPELAARKRVPLLDGRPEAIRALAGEGLSRIAAARADRARLPEAARPALYAGWLAEPVLKAARANPQAVAEGALAPSEFVTKGRLLWVAATGRW